MLYQLWMIKHSSDTDRAMAQWTKEERDEFNRKVDEVHDKAGAKVILMADSLWANEEYVYWGVTSFPSLEARKLLVHTAQTYGLYQYIENFTLLGSLQGEVQTPSYPNPIYSLWYIKNDPQAILARNSLSKEANEQLWKMAQKSMDENQVCMMLICGSYWSNDAYPAFGLEAYPNLEALQKYKADLEKLDWPLYYPGYSIMGTAVE